MRKALKKIDIRRMPPLTVSAMAQANPDSFAVHMRLAAERKKAGDAAGAVRALEQAAKLLPALQGKQNPTWRLRRLRSSRRTPLAQSRGSTRS
jgi:predicted TPR repeat methyltransferase